jgi:hypothetical protein
MDCDVSLYVTIEAALLSLTIGDMENGRKWKEGNGNAFILDGGKGCVSATGAANSVQIDMCLPVHFHDGRHVRPSREQREAMNPSRRLITSPIPRRKAPRHIFIMYQLNRS